AGRHAALDGGAAADLVEPPLEVFELGDVLALRLPADGPGIGDHVGDAVVVAREKAPVKEPVVEHAIEAVGFVGEAAHGIGLVAASYIDRHDPVVEADLLEQDGHLLAVGRRPIVEIDHHQFLSVGTGETIKRPAAFRRLATIAVDGDVGGQSRAARLASQARRASSWPISWSSHSTRWPG